MKFINYLIKPASSLCNLRCEYCFYEDEANNRSCKSMGIMKAETVDRLLEETFRNIQNFGAVNFAFQGGEPTLAGIDYFLDFTNKVKALCPKNIKVSYSIQTNGILIDDEWAKFFKKEQFLVGISIDGHKDLHNMNRLDISGEGTWNKVTKALSVLQKYHVDINALCVVTERCARSPEKVYNELKKLGLRYVQFISCLDPENAERGAMPYSLKAETYGRFLCRIFDLWYEDWVKGDYVSVRFFEDFVHILLGDSAGTCATCGKCGTYFVVEGDGSVYPCDFYAFDEWYLGKIGEDSLKDMLNSQASQNFMERSRKKPIECEGCRWKKVCNGGCQNDWIYADGGYRNYLCESFKMFFQHSMSRLMQVVRAEYTARNNSTVSKNS